MTAVARARASDPQAAQRTRTLFVWWMAYGSFYFCRVNIGPAVKSIRQDLGFSALEIGLVLGAVKLGYALGQLINGQLTERFGARRILGLGMLGSSAATLLLAAAPALASAPGIGAIVAGVGAFVRWSAGHLGTDVAAGAPLVATIVLAFVNGWFQAGGWPPRVKIAPRWFPVHERGRTVGLLVTS